MAAAELQTAGVAAGLDPEAVFAILARFVPALEMRRPGFVQDQHEPTLFAVRDLLKDLDLALGLFHGAGAQTPVTALVRELVDETATHAAGLDITAVVQRYRT
jgi:3-hydroxyisobutyrate dehydrogenase-like beta-hydroxyacid dehydrogenase